MSANEETALILAARGIAVFPCAGREAKKPKAPLTEHGFEDATTDQAQIKRWWKSYPDALIGVPIAQLDAVGVDIDCHPGKPDGRPGWKELVRKYSGGIEPNYGFGQDTLSGGTLMLFKRTEGLRIPGSLAPGIDLKTSGYFCIGEGYRQHKSHGFDRPLPQLPAWIVDLITPKAPPQEERAQLPPMGDTDTSAGNLVAAALEKWIVEEGGRNKAGYKLACQLRDMRLSEGEAERYMIQYRAGCPTAGHEYTEKEMLDSLRSAYNGSPRQPPQGKNPPKAPRARDKAATVKTPPTPDFLPQEGDLQPDSDPVEPDFQSMDDWVMEIESPAQTAESLEKLEIDPAPGTTEAPQGARPARKTSWTMAEIMGTTFQEPGWTVPERIPEGLVDICGRPKAGKSWMGLNIALAKTTGGKFLGRSVKPGKVLYLALEDNPRRIQKRLEAMGATKPGPLQFEFTWKPLHQGGLNDLLIAIEAQSYSLVVIDTLARAIPGVNHNDENPVGPIMDSLQSMAINHGMTILLIDHTRKANGLFADPIDDVMGSTAKSRTLDAVLAIYKTKGKPGATLQGRGRDIEEFEEAVTFDITTGAWQSLGDAGQLAITRQRQDIIDAVKALGKAPFAAIQKNSGIEKANLSRQLTALAAAGDLNTELIEGRVFYYAK